MELFDLLLYKAVVGDSGDGGGEISTQSLTVTANGKYTAPAGKAYTPVTVNVPNTYASADEGKVVSNGALKAQTATTVRQNGVFTTTLYNRVTVSIPVVTGVSF